MININLPLHVTIIPDANRRWAKERGLAPWKGHEAGAENLKNILKVVKKLGIKHVSFWGSSLDNLIKRPLLEKRELLRIYKQYFEELIESEEVKESRIKIRVIGKWREQFPKSLIKVINRCLEQTKNYNGYNLTFLLAYSGDDEMLSAIQKMIADKINPQKVNGELLKSYLATKDLPPVDLLIRTGGEPHMSAGFMMWDIANSELYFTKTKWPDFSQEEFKKAIKEYSKRGRRFGG